MTVTISLTYVGTGIGTLVDLYSNLDLVVPFETNILVSDLISGYTTSLVPDGSSSIIITSLDDCDTSIECSIENMVLDIGYLYNWYAVTNVANIANTDWRVPSRVDFDTLRLYLEPGSYFDTNTVGKTLKSVGNVLWKSPNTGINSVGFNSYGSGWRHDYDPFVGLKTSVSYLITDTLYTNGVISIFYNLDVMTVTVWNYGDGGSVRLVRDTIEANGTIGAYTGNDGTVYNTIVIGTQEWLSENLKETQYRDNSSIILAQDSTTWIYNTEGARCEYANY